MSMLKTLKAGERKIGRKDCQKCYQGTKSFSALMRRMRLFSNHFQPRLRGIVAKESFIFNFINKKTSIMPSVYNRAFSWAGSSVTKPTPVKGSLPFTKTSTAKNCMSECRLSSSLRCLARLRASAAMPAT